MASEILQSISRDEKERAIFRSRQMYQRDKGSDLAAAEQRGKAAGRIEGERAKAFSIAQGLLSTNLTIDEIARITGLTRTDIENISG